MTEPTNEELAISEVEALDIGAAFDAFLEAKERWIDAYQKGGRDRAAAITQLIRFLIAEREASAGVPFSVNDMFNFNPLNDPDDAGEIRLQHLIQAVLTLSCRDCGKAESFAGDLFAAVEAMESSGRWRYDLDGSVRCDCCSRSEDLDAIAP
jgi:hypothetical protein